MSDALPRRGAAPNFVFAGGGTGGHLYPGLAVADALTTIAPQAQITFLTTDRPLDRDLLAKTTYAQVEQGVRPFALNPAAFTRFALAWYRSRREAAARLRELQPRAVLGLGGYAAGPAVVEAQRLAIRAAILNPDAIPGRANRLLARRCDLVVQQWEASARHFPSSARLATWGCPIRAAFERATPQEGRRAFGLDASRKTLLVTGASQGARTINQAVQRIWPEFARNHGDWQLLHLSGALDEAQTRAAYAQAGVAAQVVAFTHEMAAALAAADLVISRAGASTLAELTTLGKPSILLPYPFHRDMHQSANARVLVEAGAATLIDDQRDALANAAPLLRALEHYADDAVRAEASAAARRLARPDAASRVAGWLLEGSLNAD